MLNYFFKKFFKPFVWLQLFTVSNKIDRTCRCHTTYKRLHLPHLLKIRMDVKKNNWRTTMNKIFIFFLLAFSTKLNCEQRGTYFSELDKKENKYPLAISYDDVATVLWCGVKCLNDNCCAQFLYDKISKHCIGVHNFEKGFISFSQISGLSDKTELYRKGNNKTLIGMIYSQ